MEIINNAIAQVSDLFRSMTPGARLTAGLLLVAVVVSLAYLFAGGGAASEEYLFGGTPLAAADVQRIEAALLSAEIPVDISGNRVRVPVSRKYEAMAAIATADAMPLNFLEIMTNSLDSASVFEGTAKMKERIDATREHILAMTINEFDWVQKAIVHCDERKPAGLRREPLVTAAVMIVPRAGETVDPGRQKLIRRLVGSAVAGIQPEQVEVIDAHHGGVSEGNSLELAAFTESPYLREKLTYEHWIREQILGHLGYIHGVRVAVHAKLQPQLASQVLTHTPDDKGTSQYTESEEETTTTTSATGGGRVGVEANGPGATQQAESTPTTQSQSSVMRDRFNNVVGYTRQTVEEAGLVPEDVKATIDIPLDWIVNTVWSQKWKLQNPDADAADMPMPTDDEVQRLVEQKTTQIQRDIENILPDIGRGEDPYPRVQVSFHETQEVTPFVEQPMTQTALAWLADHWTTLGTFLLAVVALLMLRSMVRATDDKNPAASAPRPALQVEVPDEGEEDDEEEEEESRPKLRLNRGPTLKDELAQLVREDPDTAATILRSWIGRAA